MSSSSSSVDTAPLNFKNLAMVFSLILQLSVLVWGAAKIDSSVKNLEKTVDKLVTDVRTIEDLNVRVSVLEQLAKQGTRR